MINIQGIPHFNLLDEIVMPEVVKESIRNQIRDIIDEYDYDNLTIMDDMDGCNVLIIQNASDFLQVRDEFLSGDFNSFEFVEEVAEGWVKSVHIANNDFGYVIYIIPEEVQKEFESSSPEFSELQEYISEVEEAK